MLQSDWLAAAEDCLESSQELSERRRWRSAISRAYYAAFSAAHPLAFQLGSEASAPERSIRHGELPFRLRTCLRRTSNTQVLERLAHDELVDAYNLRVIADDKPDLPLDRPAYDQARKAASRLLYAARRIVE